MSWHLHLSVELSGSVCNACQRSPADISMDNCAPAKNYDGEDYAPSQAHMWSIYADIYVY